MKTQEELIIEKCEEVKDLLIRKNRDYGNSAEKTYIKWGDVSFMLRLEDKMNRLETLIKNNGEYEVEDEKMEDTALDGAGYFLLWLVEMEKRKREK